MTYRTLDPLRCLEIYISSQRKTGAYKSATDVWILHACLDLIFFEKYCALLYHLSGHYFLIWREDKLKLASEQLKHLSLSLLMNFSTKGAPLYSLRACLLWHDEHF